MASFPPSGGDIYFFVQGDVPKRSGSGGFPDVRRACHHCLQ
jgi:hypothetical protein